MGKNKGVQLIVLSQREGLYRQVLEELEEECFDSEVLNAHSLSEAMAFMQAVRRGVVVADPDSFRSIKQVIQVQSEDEVFKLPRHTSIEGAIAFIRYYVRMNLGKNLTLLDLSSKIGLSPNYLSTLFRKETGVSLRQFIEESRLQKAAYLLEMEEAYIGEIAGRVGFTSISYFCKVFKDYFGETPRQYRMSSRMARK